jgi:hypothetical protein
MLSMKQKHLLFIKVMGYVAIIKEYLKKIFGI